MKSCELLTLLNSTLSVRLCGGRAGGQDGRTDGGTDGRALCRSFFSLFAASSFRGSPDPSPKVGDEQQRRLVDRIPLLSPEKIIPQTAAPNCRGKGSGSLQLQCL